VSSSSQLDRYTTNYKSLPKGIKADGAIAINGGTFTVATSGAGGEGIESKSTMDITDGTIYVQSSDDALNAASTFTISGGNIYAYSTGNDGMDANGNFRISGGNIVAISAGSPEVGIDANTEGGYKLYITGGNIVAVGGLENNSSLTGVSRSTASYSSNTWYVFKNGSTSAFAFKLPTVSSSGGGGGRGGMGGFGPGGSSSSSSMTIVAKSTPSISAGTLSGTTIWNGYGVVGE